MTSTEALDFGLIDKVITNRSEISNIAKGE